MLACVEKKKKVEIKISTIVIFCIIFFYLRKYDLLNSNILIVSFFSMDSYRGNLSLSLSKGL